MKGSFGLVAVLAIILAAENLEAAPKERVPTVCPSDDSPEETVLLAHESDCSKFYVCFLGEKILKECPYSNSRGDRLHFNPLLQVCDYPSEVGCQLQPIPSKQLTTSKIVPLTKEPTSQLTTPRSIPSSISSSNPSNQIKYIEHECKQNLLYEYIDDKKILKHCPNDWYWNQDLQTCYKADQKESTQKRISKTPMAPEFVPCSEGKKSRHECQCNKYYLCHNNHKILKSCKDDDHWNNVTETCTRPRQAKCIFVGCKSGYYKPDQNDCTKYYRCEGTDYVSKTCPTGLDWGDDDERCTIPEKAKCRKCPVGSTKPHERYCEYYYQCNGKEYIRKECPLGDHWDRYNNVCRRIEDARCPDSGCDVGYYKPDKNDCNKYFVCELSKYVPRSCPSGLHWNSDRNICDDPASAGCGCVTGSTKPHERYCEYYYQCNGKEYIRKECPLGDHWDRYNNVCRRIEDARCPDSGCDVGYYKPDKNDCNKYFVCELSKYVPRSCPSGLHWNSDRNICDDPASAGCGCVTGSTKPHERYCEYYYQCNGKEYIRKECPLGDHWDRYNNVCRRIEDARCPDSGCDVGYYKPDKNDCNKYFVCELSKYVPRSCPSGLHWNSDRNICDDPASAGCGCVAGSTKPHERYCEYYYQCNGKEYIRKECPLGDHWDRYNNVCRRIEDARCPDSGCDVGYYKPDKNDCNKYFVCELSKYVPRSCPSGLHWNSDRNICDDPASAGCGCVTGSTKPHERYCEYYYQCNGKEYIRKECPLGDHWDRYNNVCRRIEDARCPDSGCDVGYYKPDKNDCNKYFVCELSKYVPRSCPSGLHWNSDRNICDDPASAGCGCVAGSTKPHERYCEYYYQCNGKEYIRKECPLGEHWDRYNNVCRRIEDARCPDSGCDVGYYKPDKNDCNKYFVCELSKYVPRSCPSGLHWNSDRNICDDPASAGCGCVTGSTKPHERYCEYYYQCNGKEYIRKECPRGEHWDRYNNVCRRIEDARCPDSGCDVGYYKPDKNDCNKYFVCELSKYVPRSCPSGLHWNSDRNICDDPASAGCGCVTGSTKPHERYCEYYYQCNGKEYIRKECPRGEHWDRYNNVCRRIEDARCPSGCDVGYYKPDKNDCNKYFVCELSEYVPRSCPSGLHWDKKHNICNLPALARCAPIRCLIGSTKPHECQCEWYYSCISGEWNLQKCIGGLQWNRNKHRCDSPEKAECPTYKCKEGTYKPFPNECDKYYVCEKNEYVPRTCKPTLHWNNARNICTSVEEANCPYLKKPTCIEGTVSHHECKCEFYYQCVKGELAQRKCPDGEEWDRTNNKCDKPENAMCPYHPKKGCKEGPYKPHKNDCNKYYECIGNDYVEKYCPSGLHWDRKHNICNTPELAGCKDRCTEGSKFHHYCYCELYYECIDGEYALQQCPLGDHWDRHNNVCKRIEDARCPDSSCDVGYYKPNVKDRNKYFVCELSKYVPRSCPSGLHWNSEHNICDVPASADIIDRCIDGSTMPHACKCNLYYECIGGTFYRKECDAGKEWDSINHQCTRKEEAKCDIIKMSSDCVEDSYNVSKICDPGLHWNREYNLCIKPVDAFNPTALISTCPEGLFKPHEADCDKVYTCVNNKYIDLKCQPGYHWNRERQRCTVPSEANCPFKGCIDGAVTPHKRLCEKYNICEHGKKKPMTCPDKMHFDRKYGKCRPILKANCPMNKCTEGYHKLHETECNKYYECYKSKYVEKKCPPKQHWNPDEEKCVPSDTVNCQLCKTGDTKPHKIFCEWYYECKDGKFEKTICENGEHWDRSKQLCRPIQVAACPMNKCNEGLHKPHETECNKYYECEFNDYVLKKCSSGLHWDQDGEVCALPDEAKCPYCTEGETKPHESYCEYYYRCKKGKFVKEICNEGEQWDRDNEICRTIQLAACPVNKCTEGYYKPHKTECDKYYVCKNSDYVKKACKPNLHWDRDDKTCKLPEEAKCNSCTEGDYKPHESVCELYYKCIGGKYVANECIDGNHWDRRNHLCKTIKEAECPENKCIEGYYKPHETDCNKYYKCHLSRYIMNACPSGKYWDRKHSICNLPELTGCTFQSSPARQERQFGIKT